MTEAYKGGYQGKILEVNLTDGSTKSIEVTPELAMQFIGGEGFAAKFLWERVKPGTDPLGPDNIIMYMPGPLTGTGISGGRWAICFKSPHTGAFARSMVGGDSGPELKAAGWDGLIVTGKAPKPVYLFINDDKVELKDAASLWGKDTHETIVQIEKELEDPLVRSVVIGPAGENMVTYACVASEFYRAAGRLGGGAVMGSKNLKAVAIRGHKSVPIANVDKFWDLVRQQRAELLSPTNYWFRRWGTQAYNDFINPTDGLGVNNFQAAWLNPDQYKTYSPQFMEKTVQLARRSCPGCANRCSSVVMNRTGPYNGTVAELDFEGTANMGTGIGHTDLRTMIPVETELEKMGLDIISGGKVLSFLSELYQRGILTKADLDGIDLTWGNIEAQIAMLHKMAKREGIGEVVAQGVAKAAKKIGKGAEKYAMTAALDNEISSTDPRSKTTLISTAYLVGERGSDHNSPGGTWDSPSPEQQNKMLVFNSLVVCLFVSVDGWGSVCPLTPIYLDLLNAATGWNLSKDQLMQVGDRVANMVMAYDVREGFGRKDWEKLPDRMYDEPLPTGPNQGDKLDRGVTKTFMDNWYQARGWDPETGKPSRAKLEELGLKDVADELKV